MLISIFAPTAIADRTRLEVLRKFFTPCVRTLVKNGRTNPYLAWTVVNVYKCGKERLYLLLER